MCGRYSQTHQQNQLKQRFHATLAEVVEVMPRYNIAPSQQAPVIVTDGAADGGRKLKLMRWGLVPSWAKDTKIGNQTINARAETVAEKPSYRSAFRKRRCLVLADGYYEWVEIASRSYRVPLRYILQDKQPFAFAGIWESWKKPDGSDLETYSIITTSPNELAAKVHDRMPVILDEKDYAQWMDPSNENVDGLKKLLTPYPAKEMDAYEVSRLVNSPKNDVADCLKPVEPHQI